MHQRKRSEADWAVEILLEKQEPMYYLDLIKEISNRMGRKQDERTLSSIYTRLNLDNRLVHQGEGYWFYDTNRVKAKE
ncbi:MAG TPA: DNA-directed RNA polymerase subunit delta [Syntrophomonadaceae bacterium]|nr:DNA-directed RNA polymerase subunit delta [Syntrophomonadaceae bacterium]HOQ08544.1 DNA-directed RNA polymerase subunit delta [Syntrophomonadaceae bacterium]HPU49000.1 DNA-directed RNA polymerase subunit delta [Syntrophomonadaceae bacterium]